MAQTKHQIQSILDEAGGAPRRRFGQNFMIDQNLVRLVADAGEIRGGDVVIEVGPGTGTLTEELLARGGGVVAVEIDRDLARVLRERFASNEHLRLIEGDALAGKHDLNRDLRETISAAVRAARPLKLVANLPYNIASPLIVELLLAGVSLLAFTVQKEVAQRIVAVPGTEAYGPLSVIAQTLARAQILRTLPPQAFWPAPRVDSALVRMEKDDRAGARARDFSRFVHQLFSARRKTLGKALSQANLQTGTALEAMRIDPKVRSETLSPPQLLALFDALQPPPAK